MDVLHQVPATGEQFIEQVALPVVMVHEQEGDLGLQFDVSPPGPPDVTIASPEGDGGHRPEPTDLAELDDAVAYTEDGRPIFNGTVDSRYDGIRFVETSPNVFDARVPYEPASINPTPSRMEIGHLRDGGDYSPELQARIFTALGAIGVGEGYQEKVHRMVDHRMPHKGLAHALTIFSNPELAPIINELLGEGRISPLTQGDMPPVPPPESSV